ncbi:sensor histidine kinase [Actinoplanes sp. CA-142083]|uniref:sensor histidine kinase n=1 Tax=Actinoplanes sp. CA-142083 TaxID=3239903 RepID=UPI003D8A5707
MARRSARGWLLEVSLAVLALLLGLFFVSQSVSEGNGAPLQLEVGGGALSFVGLVLFRRSHPVALTLALIPFGILLGMPMGATPIALFSVALHRPARVTIAVAGLHAVAVATVYGLVLGLTREYYESVAFVVLLHVSLVAVAMVIRAHRQLVASWAERARQAEEGQRLRIEQARLAERERIAREMHDVLAHRVSLLALHAGALEVRRDASPDEKQAAGVIRRSAYEALEDLRMLLGMLRAPAEDRPQPTLDDVPALVERSRLAGADIVFAMRRAEPGDALWGEAERDDEERDGAGWGAPGWGAAGWGDAERDEDERDGAGWGAAGRGAAGWGAAGRDEDERDEDDVPAQTGRHAYRIIQEALTNALKHAPGAPVRVNVDICWPRGLELSVENDLLWEHNDGLGNGHGNHAEPGAAFGALRPGGAGAEAPEADAGALVSSAGGPIPGAGAGLAGLRERVRLAGGRLEHGPTPDGEFNLRAWLPWQT